MRRYNAYLEQVLDEADRLLDMDFGPIIDKILKVIPKERNTYLFSATMTTKVAKLQRASLNKPVRVEVSSKSVCHSAQQPIEWLDCKRGPPLTCFPDIPQYPLSYNTIFSSHSRPKMRTCYISSMSSHHLP